MDGQLESARSIAGSGEPDLDTPRPDSVREALEIVSDPWTFSVLQEAFFGVRRFDQLQSQLEISRSILAKRLRHLVDREIMERVRYQERPDRFEYRLTERGRALYPVFVALMRWGEEHLGADSLQLTHLDCGKPSRPRMSCDECGEEIVAERMGYRRTGSGSQPG